MSLSNKKKTQSTSNIFDDDFEVIYEVIFLDISIDDDDDYRDVLSDYRILIIQITSKK